MDPLIEVHDISKTYRMGDIEVQALCGVSLTIEAGDDTLRYCVEKGSITVEGVSLTIAALHDDAFKRIVGEAIANAVRGWSSAEGDGRR